MAVCLHRPATRLNARRWSIAAVATPYAHVHLSTKQFLSLWSGHCRRDHGITRPWQPSAALRWRWHWWCAPDQASAGQTRQGPGHLSRSLTSPAGGDLTPPQRALSDEIAAHIQRLRLAASLPVPPRLPSLPPSLISGDASVGTSPGHGSQRRARSCSSSSSSGHSSLDIFASAMRATRWPSGAEQLRESRREPQVHDLLLGCIRDGRSQPASPRRV